MSLNPTKKLKRAYKIALILIALLSLLVQVLIHVAMQNEEQTENILNVAGRQRMLSQKIIKELLLSNHSADQEFHLEKAEQNLKIWGEMHQNLQFGNIKINIPSDLNSGVSQSLFLAITPHFEAIKYGTTQIIKEKNNPNFKVIFQRKMKIILNHEEKFVHLMDKIVEQYVFEESEKVHFLEKLSIFLWSIIVMVLFLEALLIFRPAISKIEEYVVKIKQNNEELEQTVAQKTEQLQQNIEEMIHSEQELRLLYEELYTVNETLAISQKLVVSEKLEIESQNFALEKERRKIKSAINYAQRIQQAVLPDLSKMQKDFPDSFVFSRPRDVVSGDFYWLGEIREPIASYQDLKFKKAKQFIAVADCTGHGIPGAFMSLIGINLLNEILKNLRGISEPNIILNELHKAILQALNQKNNKNSDGMDISLCMIDQNNQILEFAGANSKLIYFQNQNCHVLKGDRMPVGGVQHELERLFSKHSFSIAEQTSIYLFSDGYQDQSGTNGKKMMFKPFKEFLTQIHSLSFSDQKQILEFNLDQWQGKEKQTDDIMVLGLKIC